MSKISLFMLLIFVSMNSFFIYVFYIYLQNQYRKAIKKYKSIARPKIKKIYNINKPEIAQIKNNTTEYIDHEMINSLVGYAEIDIFDKYGRIIESRTIFRPKFKIGRDGSNDMILPEQTVSRSQCLILYQNNSFFMCNLSETNPTLLNGVLIKNTRKLSFGDIINISNYTLRFREVVNEPRVG